MIVEVSIKAFIPRDVPRALVRIAKGPYAGFTAVRLPGEAYLGSPLKLAHGPVAYVGDNRDFSLDRNASARMTSRFKLDTSRGVLVEVPTHTSNESVEVALRTGQVTGVRTASTSRRRWGELREPPRSNEKHRVWSIEINAAGSDPLVWSAKLFPIRMNGRFTVERIGGEGRPDRIAVSFNGSTSHFPAFQSVARVGGIAKFVFRKRVEDGRTVRSLVAIGAPAAVRGRAIFDVPPSDPRKPACTMPGWKSRSSDPVAEVGASHA